MILCTEPQMKYLWAALGREELANDPRFDSNPHRMENRAELTKLIEDWMATFDTDEACMDALLAARVPHGPVLTPKQASEHPHFIERGVVRTIQDPLAGDIKIPAFPFRSTDPLPPDEHHSAALGEHNHEILSDMLDMSADDIAALEADGVLSSKPY